MLQVREINALVEGESGKSEGCVRRILFVISGSGMVSVSSQPFEAGKGKVFFLSGEDSLVAKAGCVVSGFLIVFNDVFFEDFLLHYPRFRDFNLLEQRVVNVASGDLLALLEELRWLKAEIESEVGALRLKTRFNLIMFLVLDSLLPVNVLETRAEKLKVNFLQLLESNFRVHRTSGFYAEKMGLTMRKLNELCRGWFGGKGFSSVHRDRLMLEAEFLLLETDKPVKEIAFELEFCSQQHFRGYFGRVKAVSPSGFRLSRSHKT